MDTWTHNSSVHFAYFSPGWRYCNQPSLEPSLLSDSCYITSTRTTQKTLFPTVTPVLRVTKPLPSSGTFVVPCFLPWAYATLLFRLRMCSMCRLFNDAFEHGCVVPSGRLVGKFGRVFKDAVVALSRNYFQIWHHRIRGSERHRYTAQVFRRDSPGKAAQWLGRSIHESWRVLWLVIRLLSLRADVSSSVAEHSSLYSGVNNFDYWSVLFSI
jgi:hypothetical protein